jgi:23S rRNA pseudouridine1911/1915/1917 synthase
VECRLFTGRTHQARVHLASVGAPVLCDREYGRRERFTDGDVRAALGWMLRGEPLPARGGQGRALLERQGLHAWQLGFAHPITGQPLHFTAELPADMAAVLAPFRAARQGDASPKEKTDKRS